MNVSNTLCIYLCVYWFIKAFSTFDDILLKQYIIMQYVILF